MCLAIGQLRREVISSKNKIKKLLKGLGWQEKMATQNETAELKVHHQKEMVI